MPSIPSRRYLTTPSGKLNFGNALARRRHLAKQYGRNSHARMGGMLLGYHLRTEYRVERDTHRANPMQSAADAVDAVLTAFEIFPDSLSREYMIRAFHEGRPAILCNSRNCMGSSIFGDNVNRGDFGAALELLSRRPAEIDRHVALNDGGANFLVRARGSVANSSLNQRAA